MLNKVLLTLSLLFFSIGNHADDYPVQKYIYEDEHFVISVKTKLNAQISGPLQVFLEFESKSDEIFVFKDLSQMDNYDNNILIIEYGGMYESSFDQPVDMIVLDKGDKWFLSREFDISKYNNDIPLKMSLSLGYIISKRKIYENRYLSSLKLTLEKNIASISSIVIDACLDRTDLAMFSIKLEK